MNIFNDRWILDIRNSGEGEVGWGRCSVFRKLRAGFREGTALRFARRAKLASGKRALRSSRGDRVKSSSSAQLC